MMPQAFLGFILMTLDTGCFDVLMFESWIMAPGLGSGVSQDEDDTSLSIAHIDSLQI